MKTKTILLLLLASILSACIQSETESFTDPEYKAVKFQRIVLNLSSLPVATRIEAEKILIERLKEAGFEAVKISDLLPPTRNYDPEEARSIIANSGIDYMLAINVLDDTSSSSVAGIYSYGYGNASAYGNRAYANANTMAVPIVAAKGQTALRAIIFDVKTGQSAWVANMVVKASGTAFVGNVQAIAHSAIGSIIDKLKADGHM
jgi:hypothetical protein